MDRNSFVLKYDELLGSVQTLTKQTNKMSVLIIQQRPNSKDTEYVFPIIRESISNIIGFVGVTDDAFIAEIIKKSVGVFDKVILDTDMKRQNSKSIVETVIEVSKVNNVDLSLYSDIETWVSAAINFIYRVENSCLTDKKVMLIGRNPLATRMALELLNRNVVVYINPKEYSDSYVFQYNNYSSIDLKSDMVKFYNQEDNGKFDILLGCSINENNEFLSDLVSLPFVSIYDVGVNNFSKEFISNVKSRGGRAFRSDDRAGIAGIVLNIMETDYLVKNNMGRKNVGKVHVVSGGVIGQDGDIVVDNVNDPIAVLGVASGEGTFKSSLSEDDICNINKIKSLIQ